MIFAKNPYVRDKKYRKSFTKHREHTCMLTGHIWQEFDSLGVDGAHITIGRYAKNLKDDSLILALRHDLHLEFDKDQPQFLIKHFDEFPMDLIARAADKVDLVDGKMDLIGVIKQLARDYHAEYTKNSA